MTIINGGAVQNLFLDKNSEPVLTTTNDWTEYAFENGYDGVIFNNIYDGEDILSNVYVAFKANQIKDTENKNPTENEDVRFSYKGINKDGVEVYETSDDVKKLTWKKRMDLLSDLITNEYRGKKARFIRNGHVFYAELDDRFARKTLYGEKHFSKEGRKAYINAGADGDLFDLVDNTEYAASKTDTKNHRLKDGFTDYFDYFVKYVQIDDKVFILNATVKKQIGQKDGYTYTLYLKEDKNKKASPAVTSQNGSIIGAGAAHGDRVAQSQNDVNSPHSDDRVNLLSVGKVENELSLSNEKFKDALF